MNLSPSRLVDSLVSEKLFQRIKGMHRYELFVAVNISLIVLVFATQLYSILLSGQPGGDIVWTLGFTVPIQIVLLVSLAIFFVTDRFAAAVHLSLVAILGAVASVIAFLGGPLGSVSVSMLFVPPVIGFILLGLRAGLVWSILTYAVIMVGGLSELYGVEFPNLVEPAHAARNELIHLNVAYLSIVTLIVFYEITNLRYRERLEEVTRQDDLTKLPNRTAFYHEIKQAIERYNNTREPFTLVYIDLDNFKPINDDYGHAIGDKVLQIFADRLRAAVRKQDFVSRLAGDEFAILLSGTVDSRIASMVMERLERQMQQPINFRNGQSIAISASTGMAFYPHDANSLETLIHAADERMYGDKRERRRERRATGELSPAG